MKSFKLIFQIFRDLFIGVLPLPVKNEYYFAFLVHPRDIADVYRKIPFSKKLPKSFVNFYCKHAWPIVVSEISGLKSQKTGKYIKGLIISIPMTAKQMIEDKQKALKRLVRAVKIGEKMGVKLVGLGALTSSVTRGGLDLAEKVNAGVTTGHAYTAYIVTKNVFEALKKLDIPFDKAKIAIVGAAGSIGSISAQILAKNNIKDFILVDIEKKNERLEEVKKKLLNNFPFKSLKITNQIHHIYPADVIIATTNAPEALITSKDVKPGAVIVDDAQPSDLSKDIIELRDDVLSVEGGVVSTKGISSHFNLGLKNKEDNFSCLAELLVLSSIEWEGNYNLGWTKIEKVKEIVEWSKSLNFQLSAFQNYKKIYKDEDINKIKQARMKYVY